MSSTTAPRQYKSLTAFVWAASLLIPIVVVLLFRVEVRVALPFDVYLLPLGNAIINGITTCVLLTALYFAKQRRFALHAKFIYLAMGLSVLFLLGYIAYHLLTDSTKFGGTGAIRTVYYILLISHIILAAVQTPFVLFAFLYGYTGQNQKHKRLVKISFPIWLYVSVTGVICYLLISPYYPV